jgi:predicted PurR-regulated permease PerM
MRYLENQGFLLLLVTISLAFGLVIWAYYEAIVWGTVVAIVFAPLYRRLRRAMRQKRNLAALASVLIILAMVILPLMLIVSSLRQEASGLYNTIKLGELNFGRYFQRILSALPTWATELLDRHGLSNFPAVQERLSAGLATASQALATRALNVGQSTFDFIVNLGIMLYLLFFLLRDEMCSPDGLCRRFHFTPTSEAPCSTPLLWLSAPQLRAAYLWP